MLSVNKKMKSAILTIAIIALVLVVVMFVSRTESQKTTSVKVIKHAVTLPSLDGIELSADLYEPDSGMKKEQTKYPGLVLLSPFGESREIYSDLAIETCRSGFVVLSVDVRNSGASMIEHESFVESVANLSLDANAAVTYLQSNPKTAPEKVAILGTAITARSALMAADLKDPIRAAILVSAALDSAAYEVIRNSPGCPILVLVSIQDGPAASQARAIYETSANPLSQIESYINAGSGSDLWRSPIRFEMRSLITEWLTKVFFKS